MNAYDTRLGAGANGLIDLRSDTVTRPSAGMRRAMADAEVGDDVYGDDPTVLRLEEMAADMLGKEAGVFVASGTASNLTALLTHCGRGDEYIGGVGYHISKYEAGGAAVLGGISPRHLSPKPNGALDAMDVAANVQPNDSHFAVTRLVCVENTWNGMVVPQADMEALGDVARSHDLAVHLDGARLMNAAIASDTSAAELTVPMDSVSLCLSKGLGAPVGSVLAGTKDFVTRARRWRKMLGGGMRQSGVVAACGLYALEHNVERLAEDHENAARLGARLAEMEGVSADVRTNMIWLNVPTDRQPLAPFMAERGLVMGNAAASDGSIRLVTHLDFPDSAMDRVVDGFGAWLAA